MLDLKKRLKEDNDNIESYFDAAEIAGLAMGMEPIPNEDYDRFWKWMMVPLKDVPEEELIWCFHQYRQNSYMSKCIWKSEIERRGLKF